MKHTKSMFTVFTTVLMASLILAAGGFSQTTDTAYVPVVVTVANVEGVDVANLPVFLKVQSQGGGEWTYHLQAGKEETLALPIAGFSSVSYRPPKQANAPTTVSHRRGRVTLRLNPEQFRSADVSLLSITGKRVWRGKADAAKGAQNVSLPNVAAGVYLLRALGINGNMFATKLTHTGGKLNVSVAVGGADISPVRKGAFSANGTWTMTAWTARHDAVSHGFTPVLGTNEKIEIALTAVSEYVTIYKAQWGLVEKSAHDDEKTARANTANMQRAIDHFYAQGHRKMRLEKMDITVWGAHPWGTSSWGGNPYENHETGVVMRTGMFFDMNGSTFRLATNERPLSTIIMIGVPNTEYIWTQEKGNHNSGNPIFTTDVEIFNGTLIGDRDTHDYLQNVGDGGGKSSHEWGTGIVINFNTQNVKVYNMVIKDVTGDCIFFDGTDHEIFNNTISRGRRNGICAATSWHGSTNNVKIHGNTIFDIYNDVPIPGYVNNTSGISAYQKEQGITYGIGAQSCIAFEGAHDYFGTHNIEIYNNHLAGNANTPFAQGSGINFHWGTKAIYMRDNIIEGGIYITCGSYLIIERNKMFNGGMIVGGHGVTYNVHLGGTRTGSSDTRNIVLIDNYMQNGGIHLNSNPAYPNEPGQEGTANVAFIGNHFINSEINVFKGVRAAVIGNRFNATEYMPYSPFNMYSKLEESPRTQGTFVYAFINNLVQLKESGKPQGTTPGWEVVRKFIYPDHTKFPSILINGGLAKTEDAVASGFAWYSETDDRQEATKYLQGFGTVLGQDIALDRYVLPVWTNWHTEFMKTHEEYYTKNADEAALPVFNGGALPNGYTPPYTLEGELQKFYQRVGYKNPQQ